MPKSFKFFILVLLSVLPTFLTAQCLDADFNLSKSSVCKNERLNVFNVSSVGTTYYWDFCAGDLAQVPVEGLRSELSGASQPYGIETVEAEGQWYSFVVNRGTGSLFRLDFGEDLQNESPFLNDLGNPAGLLSQPEDLKIIKIDNKWYGLITQNLNSPNNGIILLEFGEDITNDSPVVENLGSFGITSKIRGIDVAIDDSNIILVLTKSTRQLTLVNFRNSFSNSITSADIVNTGNVGTNTLFAVDAFNICDDWYIISPSTGNINVLSLGNDLFNNPVAVSNYPITGISNTAFDIDLVQEGDSTYAFVANLSVPYVLLNMGILADGNTPKIVDPNPFTNPILTKLAVHQFQGKQLVHGVYSTTRDYVRIDYSKNCGAEIEFSNQIDPPFINYSENGEHLISLAVRDNLDIVSHVAKSILVSAELAPPISYTSQNICRSNPIQFTSQSTSSGLTYSWDFGDAATSSDQNPSHTYVAAGEYEVTLEVSDGTCENFTRQTITVYNEPQPTFVAPTGITCTNQLLNIVNGTPGDFGGNESWEWQIDNVSVSNARDLDFTFTSGGMKEIKLIASIPGCSVEFNQNVEILDGPDPSFQVDDACVGTLMEFSNTSLGQVDSYLWDFDNGFTSNLENPSFEYADPGSYLVSLTVENSLGCITTFENIVEVFASPEVQFSNDLSCELNVTQFNDLSTVSGANITAWHWDFDDPDAESNSSSDQNSTHIFSRNGDFDVKLVTTSVFGCSDSVTQTVSVLEAPKADFTFDNACIGEAVQFQNTSIPVSGESITSFEWDIAGTFSNQESPALALGAAGDYQVTLFTISENLCLGSVTKIISIAQSPDLEIGIDRNCQNEPVKFFDLTSASVDAIESWVWNFNNQGMASDSLAFYRFDNAGTFDVGLQVTTLNGCEFALQQEVVVNPAPEADFRASVNFGAPPLNVVFENQSSGASSYFWKFDEINTSQQESPQFTYNELGEYETELIAYSDLNCSDTTRQIISVLIPELDVVLNDVVIPDDNDAPIILNLANNGSLTLNQLSANIDLGGEIQLREDFEILIRPGESTNYAMQLNILDRDIAYLCIEVSAAFPGIEDQTLGNNSICETFSDQTLIVSDAFPNPADNVLNFEAVSSRSGSFQIVIRDLSGGIVKSYKQEVLEGRIPLKIDISQLRIGMYFLQIPELNQVQKFNIAR